MLVLGRHLVNLFLPDIFLEQDYLDKIVKGIARLKQKIRPGRHAPRQSRKPIKKWKNPKGGRVAYAP